MPSFLPVLTYMGFALVTLVSHRLAGAPTTQSLLVQLATTAPVFFDDPSFAADVPWKDPYIPVLEPGPHNAVGFPVVLDLVVVPSKASTVSIPSPSEFVYEPFSPEVLEWWEVYRAGLCDDATGERLQLPDIIVYWEDDTEPTLPTPSTVPLSLIAFGLAAVLVASSVGSVVCAIGFGTAMDWLSPVTLRPLVDGDALDGLAFGRDDHLSSERVTLADQTPALTSEPTQLVEPGSPAAAAADPGHIASQSPLGINLIVTDTLIPPTAESPPEATVESGSLPPSEEGAKLSKEHNQAPKIVAQVLVATTGDTPTVSSIFFTTDRAWTSVTYKKTKSKTMTAPGKAKDTSKTLHQHRSSHSTMSTPSRPLVLSTAHLSYKGRYSVLEVEDATDTDEEDQNPDTSSSSASTPEAVDPQVDPDTTVSSSISETDTTDSNSTLPTEFSLTMDDLDQKLHTDTVSTAPTETAILNSFVDSSTELVQDTSPTSTDSLEVHTIDNPEVPAQEVAAISDMVHAPTTVPDTAGSLVQGGSPDFKWGNDLDLPVGWTPMYGGRAPSPLAHGKGDGDLAEPSSPAHASTSSPAIPPLQDPITSSPPDDIIGPDGNQEDSGAPPKTKHHRARKSQRRGGERGVKAKREYEATLARAAALNEASSSSEVAANASNAPISTSLTPSATSATSSTALDGVASSPASTRIVPEVDLSASPSSAKTPADNEDAIPAPAHGPDASRHAAATMDIDFPPRPASSEQKVVIDRRAISFILDTVKKNRLHNNHAERERKARLNPQSGLLR